jgi:uncharacterized protein (TIGR02145 family)
MIITSLLSCKKEEKEKLIDKKIEIGETGIFTDTRDGKTYKTIKIGNQTWMAENLAYLPEIKPKYYDPIQDICYYVCGYKGDNIDDAKATDNYKTYGVWYNYKAASNESNWPKGWHLPTVSEYKELEKYLGNINQGGRKIKADFEILKEQFLNSKPTDYGLVNQEILAKTNYDKLKEYFSNPLNKTKSELIKTVISRNATNNASGFSALLAGVYTENFATDRIGEYAYFWVKDFRTGLSIAPTFSVDIYNSKLFFSMVGLDGNLNTGNGLTVRLIKDKE